MSSIAEQIKVLDNLPGVYQFYDVDEKLLYVGKAKKLKNRVASYFNKKKFENGKTQAMVGKVAKIKTIHLDSEIDAILALKESDRTLPTQPKSTPAGVSR